MPLRHLPARCRRGALTPAMAAKRFAATLSKARCDEAEPEPVKAMPRISHIACSSPFSARPPCRPSTSTRSSALALSSACSSRRRRGPPGLNVILERPRMVEQILRRTSMHGVVDIPEPQIGFGQRRCSACALATETRRSLLVPPKRMVIRISLGSIPIRLISQCSSIPEFSFTRVAHGLAEGLDIMRRSRRRC